MDTAKRRQLYASPDVIINPYRFAAGLPVPGAIHWWDFSVGSGSTVPDLIGSRDGTLTGGASWSGGGVLIDASAEFIDLGEVTSSDALSGVPSGEISHIYKIAWASPSGYPRFFSKATGSAASGSYDGYSFFGGISGGGYLYASIHTTLSKGTVGTLTGTQVVGVSIVGGGWPVVFKNGVKAATDAIVPAFSAASAPAVLGNHATGARPLMGVMLQGAVWPRFLTETEHVTMAALWAA